MKIVQIKEIAEVITGGTPSTKKEEYWKNGKIPWLNSGELQQDIVKISRNYITESGLKNSSTRVLPKDTVLIALTGTTTGKVGYLTFSACANQSVTGILPSKNHFPKYLYYYLNHIRPKVINDAYGGAQPHISQSYVKNIKIPLLPLASQKKIAQILDDAADLRDKTAQLLQEYDALAQSIFLDMFGDPLRNPKGWNITRFDELVSVDCPLTYGIVQPGEEFVNGVPCVRPVDLINQYIGLNNLKMIDPVISNKFKRTLLNGGEILLSVRGSVGVISIADESLKGANVTRGLVPIWFNKSISNKLFFYYLYKTKRVQNQIKRLSKGATLIQINLKDLRELKLIQPPIGIQNQFAEKIALIEQQKALAKQELQESEDLYNCLLQKAFKGELV